MFIYKTTQSGNEVPCHQHISWGEIHPNNLDSWKLDRDLRLKCLPFFLAHYALELEMCIWARRTKSNWKVQWKESSTESSLHEFPSKSKTQSNLKPTKTLCSFWLISSNRLPVLIGIRKPFNDVTSVLSRLLADKLRVHLYRPTDRRKYLQKGSISIEATDKTCIRHKQEVMVNLSTDNDSFHWLRHLAAKTTRNRISS